MVDVGSKPVVYRQASAVGKITLKSSTLELIKENKIEKGDPFPVAKVAAILAAKNTSSIIPMCHNIPLTSVDVEFNLLDNEIQVRSVVKALWRTGVEMEALTATTVALLTVWDMVKQYEKDEEGQYPETRILEVFVDQKIKRVPNE
jgi:cyclic pyranopterin phosphate synthase